MASRARHLYEFGLFGLDATERLLCVRGGPEVPLTPKALDTLLALLERHGHIVEKEELLRKIWPDVFVEEGNLSFHIHQIRRALGGRPEQFIETIPRRGYRFVCPVTELWEGDPDAPARSAVTVPLPHLSSNDSPPSKRLNVRYALLVSMFLFLATAYLFTPRSARSLRPPFHAVPFTSLQGWESEPAFSPDGSRIAFVWDNNQGHHNVFVRALDSPALLRLTSAADRREAHPAWSPDGRLIAFFRMGVEKVELFTVPARGGPEKLLLSMDPSGPAMDLDWSPDGKVIAFTWRKTPHSPNAVFFFNVATRQSSQITSPPEGYSGERDVAFSPDGKYLAFSRFVSTGTADLYVLSLKSRALRRITSDNRAILGLDWTPDGREIIFSSHRAGTISSLWSIPVEGGTPQAITFGDQDARSLSVSKIGQRLAFARVINDHNIWRLPARPAAGGHNQAILFLGSTQLESAPQYSPDGTRVAYLGMASGNHEIWVCDSDGRDPVQLTSVGGPPAGTPRWSPDGRWIAFDSFPEDNEEILVIPSQGGPARRIAASPSRDVVPSWSRDGRWIYFSSDRSGSVEIWKVPSAGGQPVQVTRNGGFASFESADGNYLYYTKRGTENHGLWRMPVAGGAESLVIQDFDTGYWGYWAITANGIYFLRGHSKDVQWNIEFLDLRTGRISRIGTLDRTPGWGGPGLTVSPDGRWLLISTVDRFDSDIILLENFR